MWNLIPKADMPYQTDAPNMLKIRRKYVYIGMPGLQIFLCVAVAG